MQLSSLQAMACFLKVDVYLTTLFVALDYSKSG